MSLSETPARFNSDAIGASRLRRMAMACRAANLSRLAKRSGLFPRSRSTLRVRELRDCAADLTAIEGANDKGERNRKGHAPTTRHWLSICWTG